VIVLGFGHTKSRLDTTRSPRQLHSDRMPPQGAVRTPHEIKFVERSETNKLHTNYMLSMCHMQNEHGKSEKNNVSSHCDETYTTIHCKTYHCIAPTL